MGVSNWMCLLCWEQVVWHLWATGVYVVLCRRNSFSFSFFFLCAGPLWTFLRLMSFEEWVDSRTSPMMLTSGTESYVLTVKCIRVHWIDVFCALCWLRGERGKCRRGCLWKDFHVLRYFNLRELLEGWRLGYVWKHSSLSCFKRLKWQEMK